MIIRIPNTLDVVKIAAIMCPANAEDQAEFVSLWLQKQQDTSFINLVAVHKKKIMGFLAANVENTHLAIIWFKAETKDVLIELWNKVKATHEFESAGVSTGDPDIFTTLGFEPLFVVMQYNTEKSEA